ncbi:hypothetical protein [Salinibacter sp.]|uniref:hypothetical protein n=1 Tax=Salinibacter sp. TaxID=2065818 RepID=UPI0021E85274|nr:hypothetical protein [Salinibacter sp.]
MNELDPAPDDDLTAEDIRELIEAQKEEVELERERQKTRRVELESEERKAEQALEAQLKDRERQREFLQEQNRRQEWLGLAFLIVVALFLGWLVWLGYTEMVFEIIRIIVYGGAGWAAGSQVGKASAQTDSMTGNGGQ